MFKKILAGFAGLMLSASLEAGVYDGVWIWDLTSDYFVLYQKGDQLLVVNAWKGMDGWNAHIGPINGSTATISTILDPDGSIASATLHFVSQTEGTLTLHSCSDCDYTPLEPLETPLPVHKIF
jgi:hypothetical protein